VKIKFEDGLILAPGAKYPLMPDEEGAPAIPVYVLTDSGFAVAQILPNNRRSAFSKLVKIVRNRLPDTEVDALEIDSFGKHKTFDASE
jgi:hypothetical protein